MDLRTVIGAAGFVLVVLLSLRGIRRPIGSRAVLARGKRTISIRRAPAWSVTSTLTGVRLSLDVRIVGLEGSRTMWAASQIDWA